MDNPSLKFVKSCMCDKYTNCTDCQNHDNNIRSIAMLEERKRISTEITRILREHPNRIVNRFFLSELEESFRQNEVK
jgi:hypothetical protein